MIRLYEYEPWVNQETGESTDVFKDFQNYLFSHPYGFLWDFPNDKVVIHRIAYRISSLQRIPDNNQVTCLCMCSGNGNGGNGTGEIFTDVSLHGEGTEALPLGVQLSKQKGNRLQILDDGCFVGGDPVPYSKPTITLASSLIAGNYTLGDSYSNVLLTVTVTKGSDDISDVKLYFNSSHILHAFSDVSTGSKTYHFTLDQPIDNTISFRASCSDGAMVYSNTLNYTFHLPVFAGISDNVQVDVPAVIGGELLKITANSFIYEYPEFNNKHLWVARSSDREIKSISDENGFSITTAFIKTSVTLAIGGISYPYILYVFDTKTTGTNYKVTFNS